MTYVLLKCNSCGKTERRQHIDPYTGHWHDSKMVYVCQCKGDMIEVKYYPEAGACDKTLMDIGAK